MKNCVAVSKTLGGVLLLLFGLLLYPCSQAQAGDVTGSWQFDGNLDASVGIDGTFEGEAVEVGEFPMHALTQRPMAMYHSWGSQNAWLRQIHGTNPLYMNRRTGKRLEIEERDWVWVTSHHGRIKAQVKFMEGVNLDTVWTWNAIGKRSGAWNLDPKAPESQTGFLLNHVISELLPAQADGYRYSNSDPVTGQAAWYDLKVRVEKCALEEGEAEKGLSEPRFDILTPPKGLPERPPILRYGRVFSNMDDGEQTE